MNSVLLIKLGGSIITNKDIPMSVREDVLKRLVAEIAQAREELKKQKQTPLIVVGHGQGSFGHVPAVKYKTMEGFVNDESPMGMAIVQDVAAQLNRIVVREFLEKNIPAVSLYPSNSLITDKRKASSYFTEVFEEYLKHGMFPVTGGDVIVDRSQGCTLWSTEEVLSFFARQFIERGWKVLSITHVVEVDGVYDLEKKVVPKITEETWKELQKAVTATKGFDVTGGMALKVRESLDLAKLGVHSCILSGLKVGNLYNALVGKEWQGTEIL
jgi:isopentenyl phosphate kinase